MLYLDFPDNRPGIGEGTRFDIYGDPPLEDQRQVVPNPGHGRYVSAGWEVLQEDGGRHTRQYYRAYQP